MPNRLRPTRNLRPSLVLSPNIRTALDRTVAWCLILAVTTRNSPSNHDKQECTILVLGDDQKTLTAVAATELILSINETKTADGTVVSPMTITVSPANPTDGKASKFVGADPGIGNVAEFAGTVSGEIDGKPSMGEFTE